LRGQDRYWACLYVAAAGFEHFIGIDDVLNQSVANNILPGKVNELYGLDRG
jgi:hypothetical protein